jgi:hypothetical protein
MTTFEELKSKRSRRDAQFQKLRNEKANRSVDEAKKNLPLNMAESKTRHEFIRAYNKLADLLGDDELMEAEIEHVKATRRDVQRSANVNKRFESLPLERREAILAEYLSDDLDA